MNKYSQFVTPAPPILSTQNLEQQGYSRTAIGRMVKRGQLERVARGVYINPNQSTSAHQHLAEIALRIPKAAVCLISALEYHQLTTQMPFETWLAVPTATRVPKIAGIRVHHFQAKHFHKGLETHQIDGVAVRIYSPARTIADCFKFRNQIGLDVALEALKQALTQKRFTRDQLWQMARVCRVQNVITPYLEAMVSQ
jgi:predicted transcriptional regulator of viral defense system